MITITMNTTKLKLTVDGHAMPDESKQYKEICAAASALTQSLAYTVIRYNDGDGAMKSFEYRPDPGNLLLRVYAEPWAEREFRHRFEIYGDGLQMLAESHPYSVQFIRDGERIIPKEESKQ